MPEQIPLTWALVFEFTSVAAVMIGSTLIIGLQALFYTGRRARMVQFYESEIEKEQATCHARIEELKTDAARRSAEIVELRDQLYQHSQFLQRLGMEKMNAITINAAQDVNIAGDVAGKDKVTNQFQDNHNA